MSQHRVSFLLRWLQAGLFCSGTLAAACWPASAQDEITRLMPGTVLEIAAVGVPEFRYKVVVNASGEASFPLVDPMQVDGMSLADLRAKVKDLLRSKVFRLRKDGQEHFITIAADEVTLEVVEYRPVYVSGDVARPGEMAYRPGLTVRQAVALAGGYDLLRTRTANPFMEAADIRSEYEGAWIEFAKNQAQLLGARAMLDGKPLGDLKAQIRAPLPSAVLNEVAATEVARVAAVNQDLQKELAHYTSVIAEADVQVTTLQQEQQSQQEGLSQQTADLERVRALYGKNIVPMNRVSEEQRQTAFAQQRVLAVTAQLSEASRVRQEARRKLQATVDQRRVKLLGDSLDITVRIESIRARIRALDEKLLLTGAAKSQLVRGTGTLPGITIHRKRGTQSQTMVLDEDADLQPGDTVEITLKSIIPGVN